MPSLHQPAHEPNRQSPAPAGPHTGPAEPRMRHRTRGLPAASRLRCFGVAVLLAAPLFAGTASAIAVSPAGNSPVASARNPAAPGTAVAATLARFPGAAPRRDR